MKVMVTAIVLVSTFFAGTAVSAETQQENLLKKIEIQPEPLGKLRPKFEQLRKEKVRMGYGGFPTLVISPDEEKLPLQPEKTIDAAKYRFDVLRKMSESGFNYVALLFGGWKNGPSEKVDGKFPRLAEYIRFVAKGCKRNNLHLLIDFQYGQFWHHYRRYSDGTAKKYNTMTCPLDWNYWRDEMISRGLVAAKVSREYPNIGVKYDFEMYISDGTHYPGACMCDECFNDFTAFLKKELPDIDTSKISADKRNAWLTANDLLAVYSRYQEQKVTEIITRVEQALHKVNPDLVISYLPAFEWFPGMTRGFGTPEQPVLICSELEYIPGYSPVVIERKEKVDKGGYPGLYMPGLWLTKHTPENTRSHAYNSAGNADGYWVYTIDSLSGYPLPESLQNTILAEQDYWDAYKTANAAIEKRVEKGASYKPPFKLIEIPNIERPTAKVFAVRESPALDGKLNDECWKKSVTLKFRSNSTGELYSPATTARLCYDENNLYVAIQCDEPEMEKLNVDITEDGNINVYLEDSVEIFLDPQRTEATYAQILINANGAVAEIKVVSLGGVRDNNWCSEAKAVSFKRKDGWDLEVAIPLKNLLSTGNFVQDWGVNICRNRSAGLQANGKERLSAWSPTFGHYGEPSRFGKITLVK